MRRIDMRAWMLAGFTALAACAVAPPTFAQASVDKATNAQKKEAAKSFTDGMKALENKSYEDALGHFETSYDVVKSPNTLLMVGRALVALGRLGQAWDVFKQTEREADQAAKSDPKYGEARSAAKAELGELKNKAGFVTIKAPSAAESDHVVIEGRAYKFSELKEPVAVSPGAVRVTLTSGGQEIVGEANVQPGATEEVTLAPAADAPIPADDVDLAKDEPPPKVEVSTSGSSTRTLAYVAAGVGVAGLATFGVFGMMNNSKFSELEDDCPDKRCPADREDDADAGRTYQTIANIGLIVGAVGVAAGVTLFVLSGNKTEEQTALHVGPGNVGVRGRF